MKENYFDTVAKEWNTPGRQSANEEIKEVIRKVSKLSLQPVSLAEFHTLLNFITLIIKCFRVFCVGAFCKRPHK